MPWDIPGRLQGIDISRSQAKLPMEKLRDEGVAFVTVKATQNQWRDPMFHTHCDSATAAGLPVGSYHFLHSNVDGATQAEAYVKAVESRKDQRIKPCLDWEDAHRVADVGPLVARDHALAFLHRTWSLWRKPQVYTGPGFIALFRGVDMSAFAEFDLWVAHYRWDPATGRDYGLQKPIIPQPWTEARAWQCGGNGAPRFKSVLVDLDRDIFYGTQEEFDYWCDSGNPDKQEANRPSPHDPGTMPGDFRPGDARTVAEGLGIDLGKPLDDE